MKINYYQRSTLADRSKTQHSTSPVATGGFARLSPTNKTPSPPNLNMKHYKSVGFLSNFKMSSDPAQT